MLAGGDVCRFDTHQIQLSDRVRNVSCRLLDVLTFGKLREQCMASSDGGWKSVLTLDRNRRCIAGSAQELNDAIRRGADLRIYTEFRHNEHLDTNSDSDELVQEVSEFRVTYLLDDRWSAGIMTLRQPIEPPVGFGPRPSMSFFLYNQNGQQAIARPYLDGPPAAGVPGPAELADFSAMPKYQQLDNWDDQTNAPSHNFVYEFDTYRFCVRDDWQEVLAHNADGDVQSGSLESLIEAFRQGARDQAGDSRIVCRPGRRGITRA